MSVSFTRASGVLAALLGSTVATPLIAQTDAKADPAVVAKPAALIADGVPAIPTELADKVRPYIESRSAGFSGWNYADRSMLITTRFGNVAQVHRVATPGGARTQLSFEADRVGGGRWSEDGKRLLVSKDIGGNEFFQIYELKSGRLHLLTDGKSRNSAGAWSDDGTLFAFSSTKRNGKDNDLYVMNPADPASARMVQQVEGGGWGVADFAPDNKSAVVTNYTSVTHSALYLLDLTTSKMTPIGDSKRAIAWGEAEFAPDGKLWVTSDEGSDFQRLGTLDVASGTFTPIAHKLSWDVDTFDIAPDGSFIAFVTNEAGSSRLNILDVASGNVRRIDSIPAGVIGGIDIAPWGEIGFSLSSAKSATDAYSVDARTGKLTRWTMSETGGLDPTINVEPQLIEVKSFDGEKVSGFLYKPDPAKFPGKRPLIMSIHGGPEGQSRPGFMGSSNYLLNEMGVAIFYPNVRGSTGYGKRFVSLDNGPFLRENSVKDVGAFLNALEKDPTLDKTRFAVQGGSYGGYMCYASAVHYAKLFRAANCIVAISNFVTFLENTQSYRRDLRRVEYGDERDAKQRAKLMEISPLTRVKEIRMPTYVVTGANDPRVPQSEADQIVAAIRANGGTAWHLVGKDEGHGFAKKANQEYQLLSTLMFWEQNLLK